MAMHVRYLAAFAGAAMIFSPTAQAAPTIGAVYNFSDPFLVANNLVSVTIRLENIQPGERIRGFKATGSHPWNISTLQPNGFFNLAGTFGDDGEGNPTFDGATSRYAATPSTAPDSGDAGRFDSGFLGQPTTFNFLLGNGIGGFALAGDGNDIDLMDVVWMTQVPTGIDPPNDTFNILRLTHSIHAGYDVRLVLVMGDGQEIPLQHGPPLWDSGGACCLPNGGCQEMYIIPCLQLGGTLHNFQHCEACPNYTCAGDIAPPGGDNLVNVQDLLAVIGAWGPCSQPYCPADVAPPNGFQNGIVNVADLLAVIGAWGPCPK